MALGAIRDDWDDRPDRGHRTDWADGAKKDIISLRLVQRWVRSVTAKGFKKIIFKVSKSEAITDRLTGPSSRDANGASKKL